MQKTVTEIHEDSTSIYSYIDRYAVTTQESNDEEIYGLTSQYETTETLLSFQETYASSYLGKGSTNTIATGHTSIGDTTPKPLFIPKTTEGSNAAGQQVGAGSSILTVANGIWVFPPGGTTPASGGAGGSVSPPRPFVVQHYQYDTTTTLEKIKAGNSSNVIYVEAFDNRFGDPEDNFGEGVEYYLSTDAGSGDDQIMVDGPYRYID